jgi:hypothetical protein
MTSAKVPKYSRKQEDPDSLIRVQKKIPRIGLFMRPGEVFKRYQ